MDFVETPSTLMEYYAYSPRVLSLFARHWRTGAPIPESDLTALQVRITRTTAHAHAIDTDAASALQENAARFGGMEAQLQVLYSMMDIRFHDAHPLPASTTDILRDLQNRYYSIPYAGTRALLRVCVRASVCRTGADVACVVRCTRGDQHAGELRPSERVRRGLLQLPLLPRLLGQHLAPLLRARSPQPPEYARLSRAHARDAN
jgi:hypothetical protein